MFPVGEALMLIPAGNSAQSHFFPLHLLHVIQRVQPPPPSASQSLLQPSTFRRNLVREAEVDLMKNN